MEKKMDTQPYREYAQSFASAFTAGKSLPMGGMAPIPCAASDGNAPVSMIFAPHPDDECIIGLLPLRLQREAGWRVVNVPVTHGSHPARQEERAEELAAACAFLGWELAPCPPLRADTPRPAFSQAEIVTLLQERRPAAVFFPHAADWNARHVFTHRLLMGALGDMPSDFSCEVLETEFWGAMDDPNLIVEGGADEVGDLMAALSFHRKEVERNPYHLRLPAWMMDNVRRGAERLGGQGSAAPEMTFATLYRHSRWADGGCRMQPVRVARSGSILEPGGIL